MDNSIYYNPYKPDQVPFSIPEESYVYNMQQSGNQPGFLSRRAQTQHHYYHTENDKSTENWNPNSDANQFPTAVAGVIFVVAFVGVALTISYRRGRLNWLVRMCDELVFHKYEQNLLEIASSLQEQSTVKYHSLNRKTSISVHPTEVVRKPVKKLITVDSVDLVSEVGSAPNAVDSKDRQPDMISLKNLGSSLEGDTGGKKVSKALIEAALIMPKPIPMAPAVRKQSKLMISRIMLASTVNNNGKLDGKNDVKPVGNLLAPPTIIPRRGSIGVCQDSNQNSSLLASPAKIGQNLLGTKPSQDQDTIQFQVPRSPSRMSNRSMFNVESVKLQQIDATLYDHRLSASCDTELTGECGSLHMSMAYDSELSLLMVQLLHATQLSAPRTDGQPNPYVRLTLVKPAPSAKHQMHQTKVYNRTESPLFVREEFCFDVPAGRVSACKLEALIYDYDQCSVDECLGYCWLSLSRLDISTDRKRPTTFWAEILPVDCGKENHGEILFSLNYLSKAQRLCMNVFKARNLIPPREMREAPVPFVRVTLLADGKRVKRKRTGNKKGTTNPCFNEGLAFNLPTATVRKSCLLVEVLHEVSPFLSTISPPQLLGSLMLPLCELPGMLTSSDLDHRQSSSSAQPAQWHALVKPSQGLGLPPASPRFSRTFTVPKLWKTPANVDTFTHITNTYISLPLTR